MSEADSHYPFSSYLRESPPGIVSSSLYRVTKATHLGNPSILGLKRLPIHSNLSARVRCMDLNVMFDHTFVAYKRAGFQSEGLEFEKSNILCPPNEVMRNQDNLRRIAGLK